VDDFDAVRRVAAIEQEPTVVLGDRHHEARVGGLALEEHRAEEEVVGVRREAEGDAGQPMDDPGRGGRLVGEVRVDVRHPLTCDYAGKDDSVGEDHGSLRRLQGRVPQGVAQDAREE